MNDLLKKLGIAILVSLSLSNTVLAEIEDESGEEYDEVVGRSPASPASSALVWVDTQDIYYYMTNMDRLTKRLGSLDDYRFADDKTNGLWLRTEQGKFSHQKEHFYQLGYNHSSLRNDDIQWLNGISLNYLKGSHQSYEKGVSLHSTFFNYQKHYYLDMLLHYGAYKTNIYVSSDDTLSRFTHKGKLLKLSLEAGYEKKWENNWFLRPQAQLQFAHTKGKNYMLGNDNHLYISNASSLVGRLGFELGKNFKTNHRIFVLGNLYHEFLSSKGTRLHTSNAVTDNSQYPKDWYDIGIGYSYKGKHFTPYINAERSFYKHYGNSTRVNAGISYSF
ncbi:hypothetical protein QV06_06065 [Gallibacterium genomosp. 3]|uniref:Autotransporter domain-containing protein n=1 Tax=Gallibacterium genomosp. 3 TaxID=505345 RepID=A0A1A7PS65_9PAST|nr:autotransporter outer membrane beta-barrel domain-containing protein [Gallibacterium genomosp. 3]OBX04567.1 hypothetical protein QV06_06065 [Gallibacterium genomosp. 3]